MRGKIENIIANRIKEVFTPSFLRIFNNSDQHQGHLSRNDGNSHFSLVIVSQKFDGISSIGRHRMVYKSLSFYLSNYIHALEIKAYTASEFERKDEQKR